MDFNLGNFVRLAMRINPGLFIEPNEFRDDHNNNGFNNEKIVSIYNTQPSTHYEELNVGAYQCLINIAKHNNRDEYVQRLRIVRNETIKNLKKKDCFRAVCIKCERRMSNVQLRPCGHMYQCDKCYWISGTTRKDIKVKRCDLCAMLIKEAIQWDSKTH